jgi:hypothetical protein
MRTKLTQVATYHVRGNVIPTQEESPLCLEAATKGDSSCVGMTNGRVASRRNVKGSNLS